MWKSREQGRIQDFYVGEGAPLELPFNPVSCLACVQTPHFSWGKRGGVCTQAISCFTSTPTNHSFFLQNTSCIRKLQVISRDEWMTSDNFSYFFISAFKRDAVQGRSWVFLLRGWGGGGGALTWLPKVRALWGGLRVSSPRKVSNLEATKRYFQHLSWDMSPKNRPRIWKWQTIASQVKSSHYNQNN